jgi:hypothetical protein
MTLRYRHGPSLRTRSPFCVGITALRTMGTATEDWLLCAPWWSD